MADDDKDVQSESDNGKSTDDIKAPVFVLWDEDQDRPGVYHCVRSEVRRKEVADKRS